MTDETMAIIVGFVMNILAWTVRFAILGCGVYIVIRVLRVLEVIP
jgi:hypothetical protein